MGGYAPTEQIAASFIEKEAHLLRRASKALPVATFLLKLAATVICSIYVPCYAGSTVTYLVFRGIPRAQSSPDMVFPRLYFSLISAVLNISSWPSTCSSNATLLGGRIFWPEHATSIFASYFQPKTEKQLKPFPKLKSSSSTSSRTQSEIVEPGLSF